MPEMSLSEAAKWAGKGRPAILKAIQKGTLSARRDDAGQWRIDPAELGRVYQPGTSEAVSESQPQPSQEPPGREQEIALLREIITDLRKQRDDWQGEAAKWQAQAESATRLITHQAQQADEPEPARGWFNLRRRKVA